MLYSVNGLHLKQISELYFECRTLAYASFIVKADSRVQHALQSKLDREVSWSRKMKKHGLTLSKSIVDDHTKNDNTRNEVKN